jgi:hypothetical protein
MLIKRFFAGFKSKISSNEEFTNTKIQIKTIFHTVATGAAGEPIAPGKRKGGAVSKNRCR